MRRAVAVLVGGLLLVACRGGGDPDRLVLDGRARFPDDEGLVTRVSVERITLDGKRTYDVSRQLQAFSTYSLQAVPLLQRQGQYVQVGLDGRTVTWLAAIGAVIESPAPLVYYTGHFLRLEKGRAVFRDGTTLALGPGLATPRPGQAVAQLDPATHRLRSLDAQ